MRIRLYYRRKTAQPALPQRSQTEKALAYHASSNTHVIKVEAIAARVDGRRVLAASNNTLSDLGILLPARDTVTDDARSDGLFRQGE